MRTHENIDDADDEIRAENELLKLKLELEHGAMSSEVSALGPELENQWLKNIIDFENQYKNAKRIKVYDFIDRPEFEKIDKLSPKEISGRLTQLLSLLEKKGIVLDCCCKYGDATIYRFLTDEFFEVEIDDISIEGMTHHFIYEEFHPNHDNDLRRSSNELVDNLLKKKWDSKFDAYSFGKLTSYKGKQYTNEEMSSIIVAFQTGRSFQLETFTIEKVSFNVEQGDGKVQASLAYYANSNQGKQFYSGEATMCFTFEYGYWYLTGFLLPGFGE